MNLPDKEQFPALKAGALLIGSVAVLITLIWLAGYLPGPVGDAFGLLSSMFWTPLIMEPTLFIIGLSLVISLNYHRRQQNPECVYLETVDSPTAQARSLPAQARSTSPANTPLPPSDEEMIATIEGALELGDYQQVSHLLIELPDELLVTERILAVRLQLAIANDDPNHIRGLSRKLRNLNPSHPLLDQVNLGLRS